MYHFITIVACCTVKLIIIIWVGAQSRCPGSGRLPRADGDISTSVPPNKCPLHSANDDNNPTTGWDVLKLLQTCRWKQLRHVPRAARSNLADLLSEIFSTIASGADECPCLDQASPGLPPLHPRSRTRPTARGVPHGVDQPTDSRLPVKPSGCSVGGSLFRWQQLPWSQTGRAGPTRYSSG